MNNLFGRTRYLVVKTKIFLSALFTFVVSVGSSNADPVYTLWSSQTNGGSLYSSELNESRISGDSIRVFGIWSIGRIDNFEPVTNTIHESVISQGTSDTAGLKDIGAFSISQPNGDYILTDFVNGSYLFFSIANGVPRFETSPGVPIPSIAEIVNGAVQVTTDPNVRPSITASFKPSGGLTLAATYLSLDTGLNIAGFNWQSEITNLPSPSPFFANADPCVESHPFTFRENCTSLSTPSSFLPSGAIPDPPPGGYTYQPAPGPFPFYLPESFLAPGVCFNSSIPALCPAETSTTINFYDDPADTCLFGADPRLNGCNGLFDPAGSLLGFTTDLVTVFGDGTPGLGLFEFDWTSDFNGTAGGISRLDGFAPPDLDSGTGGVTILDERYSGIALPTSVPEPPSWMIFLSFLAVTSLAGKKLKAAVTQNFVAVSCQAHHLSHLLDIQIPTVYTNGD